MNAETIIDADGTHPGCEVTASNERTTTMTSQYKRLFKQANTRPALTRRLPRTTKRRDTPRGIHIATRVPRDAVRAVLILVCDGNVNNEKNLEEK